MTLASSVVRQQIVGIELGDETYGIEIDRVQEIVRLQPITAVPCANAGIEGVTNLRGKVLPIVDLRKRCRLPVTAPTRHSRVVVADLRHEVVGLVVDGVSEIISLDEADIDPPDPLTSNGDTLIAGVTRLNGRLLLLMDPDSILDRFEAVR
jgi:purine-binding chemotaxis protein CheW